MKPFRFKRFSIEQSEKVFRVGTDAVLLGALSSCETAKNALEIGCGTGVISLMTAQRNTDAEILAIDIDGKAVALANSNFYHSPFRQRLRAGIADAREFISEEKFDLIISNPPYFEDNISVKDKLARQQTALNFTELIYSAARNLTKEGMFSVIIPAGSAQDFVETCQTANLHLVRKINIYGIANGNLKRNVLEFSFDKKEAEEQDFYIEKSPRNYSDQYLLLTKDFHVFGN